MSTHLPVIAIVGRPNVGKSSLFNAILGRRVAIVHQESGVTRDRITAVGMHSGRRFQLVDTGGLALYAGESAHNEAWAGEIRRQVETGMETADSIIFVVECGQGPTPLDTDIAAKLRVSGKQVVLAVNKSDNEKLAGMAANFAELGFERIFPISCVHSRGMEEMMDTLISGDVAGEGISSGLESRVKIAVAGRPNVGKSSFINKFIGDRRMIVSELPGTTRDAVEIDYDIKFSGETVKAVFIDTAGLRQKRKADTAVEFFSMDRTEKAVMRADIVILLLDATAGRATAQDCRIAAMIRDSGKGCIIAANKWDLCHGMKEKNVADEIRYTMPFLDYAPLIFVSSLKGYNFDKVVQSLFEISLSADAKPPTPVVNKVFENAFKQNPPPTKGSAKFKVYYSTYLGGKPPRFVLFCNNPELCPEQYLKFLANSLRAKFYFPGYPIKFQLRRRAGK